MSSKKTFPKLVVATGNRHKFNEIRTILSDLPAEFIMAPDLGAKLPEESKEDMKGNAVAKAVEVAKQTGLIAIADDSGLEVDALGGRPGPLSSKFGGEGLSDAERYQLLLRMLKDVPDNARTARFRCIIAIALPNGETKTFHGVVKGMISHQPKGSFGFGYDPVFLVPRYKKTMAELGPGIKNQISHRAKALQKAKRYLLALWGK